MRKTVLAVLLVLLMGSATAEIEAEISPSCEGDQEPLISMQNSQAEYSNPGHPSHFEEKVCVRGIREAKISNSCTESVGFYLSSNDTDSHFSKFSSYNFPVCTGQMITAVRDSCLSNQTALFSVSSEHNGHVAEPGFYPQDVCGFYAPPENVQISVEFNSSSADEVCFDEEKKGEEEFRFAEFPYMVSDSEEYVSGLVPDNFLYAQRTLEDRNRLSIRRTSSQASYLFPLTEGDYRDVERHQQEILGNTFLDQLEPSFSFYIPEEATVRASLNPAANISGSLSL
jgi:hypothetical protein